MTKNKKGFTIIEVVLVLAIAGLIFLMVFIALPALQRSQRNTQREDDISRFLTAANDFQTNNNGKTPFLGGSGGINSKFVNRYIDNTCNPGNEPYEYECDEDGGKEFTDPDGSIYKMRHDQDYVGSSDDAVGGANWEENDHTVHAWTNASCGDEGEAVEGTGIRQYALFYVLEGDSVTCNDNH